MKSFAGLAVPSAARHGAWAGMLFLLAGCMGGSDGVENPKLELEFPEAGTSAGSVRVYGSQRDPRRDSIPLLQKSFAGSPVFSASAAEMDSALRADLIRRGRFPSNKDTVVEFQVVASAEGRENFLVGFRYRNGERRGFARGAAGAPVGSLRFGDYRESALLPPAVLDYPGKVGDVGAVLGLDYVYIPGSPYQAPVAADQSFVLPRLAVGIHGLAGVNADADSAYLATDSLVTADSAFAGKNWDAIVIIRE